MKNRWCRFLPALAMTAAAFCLFTGCPKSPSSPELAVFHSDTLQVKFAITGQTMITGSDTGQTMITGSNTGQTMITGSNTGQTMIADSGSIDLGSVRNAISSSNIDASSLVVTDIEISIDPTDSISARIIAADAGLHLLAKVYFSIPPAPSWELFVLTDTTTGASISRLATEFMLNRDIFGVNPGFTDFENAVKNPAISELGFLFNLTLLQAPPAVGMGVLKLKVIISEAGKVKS